MLINKEVALITGLSQRQVISWSEKGIVRVENEIQVKAGRHRQYSFNDLIIFMVAKKLSDFGFEFQYMKYIIESHRKELLREQKEVRLSTATNDANPLLELRIIVNLRAIKELLNTKVNQYLTGELR